MANSYIPVTELPVNASVSPKAGFQFLGETRQGLIEVTTDKAYVGWLSRYKRLLSVMVGAAPINWVTMLPCKDAVRQFRVEIKIRVNPSEPTKLAGSAGYDFAADIMTEVNDSLRQISRTHESHEVAQLENNMRRWSFNQLVVLQSFVISYGAFSVEMDAALAQRVRRREDGKQDGEENVRALERRMHVAQIIFQFLPNTPSRAAVAFDLAENPSRVSQYIEVIEKSFGEQQRSTIEKLERIEEFYRQGSLDSVDLAKLLGKVLEDGDNRNIGKPATPRALPSS